MKLRLRTKLTAAFAATALLCVLLIGLFSNMQLEKHFQLYVQQNQDRKNLEIVQLVTAKLQRYTVNDVKSVEDVGVYALGQGLMIKVMDTDRKTIWDAYVYNNGMCQQITQNMSQNMMMRYPGGQGKLMRKSFDLSNDTGRYGTIEIDYYGPYYFNDSDMMFIRTLNQIFIGVGVFSLLLALAFGILVSRQISTPITRVILTAQSIAKGYYGDRSHEKSGTVEINQLTRTINNLAGTLENQENLRKRLTADVAHELRTPLATLTSHVETMIDGIWEPTRPRLESLHEEITRMSRLVSNLEKIAHYESENLVLQKTEFSAADFMNRLIQAYEAAFVAKDVKLALDCDDSVLVADRDKMSQVIINLITNALKFTPAGGKVTIRVRDQRPWTSIQVSDTGQGISENDLSNIFQRFYRADVSRNRTTGGTGIGLTLVKAIVEAHGGTVEVTSMVNEGTQFVMKLPQNT